MPEEEPPGEAGTVDHAGGGPVLAKVHGLFYLVWGQCEPARRFKPPVASHLRSCCDDPRLQPASHVAS